MNPDLLQRHFEQTPAPSDATRSRIAHRLDDALRASPDGTRDRRGRRYFPRKLVGRLTLVIPSVAILVGIAVTLNNHNRPSSRPSIVGLSAAYGLADPGTPVALSSFDANSQQLLEENNVSGASDLGDAGGRTYFQFTTTGGTSCYGRADESSAPITLSVLNCFADSTGLSAPVLDMSTVALDPADTSRSLHLIDVGGIAASQVATMRFMMTDGQTVEAPVVGDVYGLPKGQSPTAPLASITALSATGQVLWEESYR